MSQDNQKRRDPVIMDSGATSNARIVRLDDGTEHGQLVITIDLNRTKGPASTGKNMLTASVGANLELNGVGKLGLNLFRPPKTDAELTACASNAAKVEEMKAIDAEYKARVEALKARGWSDKTAAGIVKTGTNG